MSRRNQKKNNTKGKKLSSKQLSNTVLRFLSMRSNKNYSTKQILSKLNLVNSKDSMHHVLNQLSQKGLIIEENGFYKWNIKNAIQKTESSHKNSTGKTYTGRVDMTRSGAAYIVISGMEEDVYVPARSLKGAMNRDLVTIEVPYNKRRRKPEGVVIKIEKRSMTHAIGQLKDFGKYGVVSPVLKNNTPDVYVNSENYGNAKNDDFVIVEVTKWGASGNNQIWGKVTRVLEEADENDMAMQSILMSNGFNLDFPEDVLVELEKISGEITEEELDVRRDMREILTFTIDPATAKDFDDAISYEVLENGHIEIGVHIADVTHFLREDTALDKEALDRSTSVYLVDRVLPMLPEKLSNDLCSLNPDEDKYTFSAVFTFDDKYKIVKEWLGKTVIHSSRRFTYEEAQERLETGDGDLASELRTVNSIAAKLRKQKFKNGAINFESDEVRFTLDENNKPIGVYVKERKEANMLIEDFMLLANKTVATYMFKKSSPEIPFVYRVHDMPDPDKLMEFALFAKEMGYPMKVDTPNNIAKSFNGLAKAAESNDELKMLMPLAIRTMSKAVYTSDNIGHYGLSFDYYTHFTSPIRRYSDVLVHRILYANLKNTVKVKKELLETKCVHISSQERKAMTAERDSIKYKQVEYMLDKVGEEFIGVVSGMIDRGFFVEVTASKAEGMIPFDQMDEPYQITEGRLKAVAKHSKDVLKMGSKVKVKLEEADLKARLLYFTLIEVL